MRILSSGISALFHPLLLPTYSVVLISYFAPLSIAPLNTLDGRTFIIGLIFMSTFFLPFLLLTLYIMIQNGGWTAKKFLMENSKERVFPFMVVGVFYSVVLYFIRQNSQFSDVILVTMTCATIAILMIALISNYWKISAHAVGMFGTIGILAVVNNKVADAALFYPILILLVLAGFLMSSRLYLNAHTPKQILFGALLGILISLIGYIFL